MDRIAIARDLYHAFETGDRDRAARHLTDDFTFHSPPDPHLDRAQYFERCWPSEKTIYWFDFKRLVEHGDEVIVTYEATRTDGSRFRNTEVMTFDGDKVCRVEVYFGWNL